MAKPPKVNDVVLYNNVQGEYVACVTHVHSEELGIVDLGGLGSHGHRLAVPYNKAAAIHSWRWPEDTNG